MKFNRRRFIQSSLGAAALGTTPGCLSAAQGRKTTIEQLDKAAARAEPKPQAEPEPQAEAEPQAESESGAEESAAGSSSSWYNPWSWFGDDAPDSDARPDEWALL